MFKRRQDDDLDGWDIPDLPDSAGWGEEFEAPRGRRKRQLALSVVLLIAAVALVIWLRGRNSHPEQPAATPPAFVVAAVLPTTPPQSVTHPGSPTPLVATPTSLPTPLPTAPAGDLTAVLDKPAPGIYDPVVLSNYMFDLLNADRAGYGLSPLAWDETAARAGALHAADMIAQGYFSHWNTQGFGPDHRYALLAGEHAVMENLHALTYTYGDGRGGAPIEDWASVIEQAQAGLMLSPGHRANILDPAHTHVGIGMAYDSASGEFRLAQEFINQYATLTILPPDSASAEDAFRVAGRFNDGPLTNFILSLAYQPWPEPMTPDELNRTSTYRSPAESRESRLVDRVFDETLTLGEPGLYHVRLYVDLPSGQALVVDRLIRVE